MWHGIDVKHLKTRNRQTNNCENVVEKLFCAVGKSDQNHQVQQKEIEEHIEGV